MLFFYVVVFWLIFLFLYFLECFVFLHMFPIPIKESSHPSYNFVFSTPCPTIVFAIAFTKGLESIKVKFLEVKLLFTISLTIFSSSGHRFPRKSWETPPPGCEHRDREAPFRGWTQEIAGIRPFERNCVTSLTSWSEIFAGTMNF